MVKRWGAQVLKKTHGRPILTIAMIIIFFFFKIFLFSFVGLVIFVILKWTSPASSKQGGGLAIAKRLTVFLVKLCNRVSVGLFNDFFLYKKNN